LRTKRKAVPHLPQKRTATTKRQTNVADSFILRSKQKKVKSFIKKLLTPKQLDKLNDDLDNIIDEPKTVEIILSVFEQNPFIKEDSIPLMQKWFYVTKCVYIMGFMGGIQSRWRF